MMTVTRRTALGLVFASLAVPARAACAPLDLVQGVTFRRQDGSRGVARREGDGTVYIDYVTNRGAWLDQRRVKNGVFEVSRVVDESEEPVVGSSAPSYAWTYGSKLIVPQDGAVWSGRIRQVVEVTISDERGTVDRRRGSWQASYRCFDPREVTLSGCALRALTVEADWQGEGGTLSQRWVYFPDLGLGLETRRNGKSNGITALTPA